MSCVGPAADAEHDESAWPGVIHRTSWGDERREYFGWSTVLEDDPETRPGVQQEPVDANGLWDDDGEFDAWFTYTGPESGDAAESREEALDWLWRNAPLIYTPQTWCGDLHGAWCGAVP